MSRLDFVIFRAYFLSHLNNILYEKRLFIVRGKMPDTFVNRFLIKKIKLIVINQ